MRSLSCKTQRPARAFSRSTTLVGALIGTLVMTVSTAHAQSGDHFTCYRAAQTSGTGQFVAVQGVSLVDQFHSSTVEVKKPKMLCAPTNKNGEDPTAPSHPDHLEDYLIKPATRFTGPGNLRIVNQFGVVRIDAKRAVALQVPTAKSHAANPPAPTNPAVDHFTCYKAKVTTGAPAFARISGVTIEDQFGQPMTVDVIKPSRLCLPTNKQNEDPGADTHEDHLLCYKIKQTNLPRFTKVVGLFTNNQFGPGRLDAKRPKELCVPALKNPVPTPTVTPTRTRTPTPVVTATPPPNCGDATLDPGEQCDGALNAACGGAPCTAVCTCGCLLPNPLPDRLAYVNRPVRDSDTGWTGLSHDLPGDDESPFNAVRLSDCDTNPASPTCGACLYDGPVGYPGPTKNCRCLNLTNRNTSSLTDCDPEAQGQCGILGETCQCLYGPPLPLTAGAISACIVNRVAEPIFGTVNIADVGPHAGESAGFLHLESGAHTAPTQDEACPQCLGDTTPRDGVRAGTCSYGARAGQPCDESGSHDIFGLVSFDCLPNQGANIGNLTILIPNQTTQTSTLTTTGVHCTAPNFTASECPCDTCATAEAEPCNSNADCPDGVVCGGKRCIAGSNAGQPCTTASQCPGGGCGRAGAATATNACADATCSPATDDPASPNDGVCAAGPIDQFCDVETFRGCANNSDCNPPPAGNCAGCASGQTCIGKNRECFLDPIVRTGMPGTQLAVIATTYCIPPSASPAVNSAPGLPGAGSALEPTRIYQIGPTCGNGAIDANEDCDSPAGGACPATCQPNCRCPVCGDGYRNQPTENCDGGDDSNCPGDCQANCGCPQICGDNLLQFGEECDGTAPGSQCPAAHCTAASQPGECTCQPYCGDGTVDPGEQCDGVGSMACPPAACQPNCTCGSYCGDGIINGSEVCDGSATGSCAGTCQANCTCSPFCGNNLREASELCDGSDDDACPGECTGPTEEEPCTCPSIGELTFTVQNGADLDAGWTGTSHDFPWTTGARIPGEIGGCQAGIDNECTFLANVGSRCSGDGSILCTGPGQCPAGQSCIVNTFGPPLPLTSGGVPACVVPIFRDNVTGTYNLATGSSAYFLPITAVVYVGTDTSRPCPYCQCDNHPNPDDCQIGDTGSCSDNPLNPCTVEGTSTFGPTSNACRPNPAADISSGGLALALDPATTGPSSFASSTPCTGAGFQTQGCWGAGQPQPSACETACDGGGNDAEPCTVASECPGGTCVPLCRSIAGQTRPNQGTQAVGEAECVTGPTDGVCSGNTFITCSPTQPCPPGLGSCVGEKRRCFLDPIVRVGTPGTTTDVIVGTFFVPATNSPAINQVAGLPGPGAVRFPMTVTAAFCGDNVKNQASEQCDGPDAANCPGVCQTNCTCPPPVCGNGAKEIGEQCDPGGPGASPPPDDDACVGLCTPTCTCPGAPVCGDGVVTTPEQCDPGGSGGVPPPNDTACPGLCKPVGDPLQCQCGTAVCGNGVIEGSEFCELPSINCGPLQVCNVPLCTQCVP